MQPWDGCSIGYASSHSHSHFTSAWFASSPLPTISLTHSTPPGLAVLHSHQALKASTHYFGLVCFFPSPLPSHLPIHTASLAVLCSIKHLRHQHILWLGLLLPSPLPLVLSLTLPNRLLPQYMARWLVWSFGVHRM